MEFCTRLIRNRCRRRWIVQTYGLFSLYWLDQQQVATSGTQVLYCDNGYYKQVFKNILYAFNSHVEIRFMDTFTFNSRYWEPKIGIQNHRLIFPCHILPPKGTSWCQMPLNKKVLKILAGLDEIFAKHTYFISITCIIVLLQAYESFTKFTK